MDYEYTQYPEALEAMHLLLQECKVSYWDEWIKKDIEDWRINKSAKHHLSAYGGMGWFNDVIICVNNGHQVTKERELWIHCLFNDLQSICWSLAKYSDIRVISLETLQKNMSQGFSLSGQRCLSCGYSEVSNANIEYYIAHTRVRTGIIEAYEAIELVDFVRLVLSMDLSDFDNEREIIKRLLSSSSIKVMDRQDWMRPCPNCNSEDTCIYRWIRTKKRVNGTVKEMFVPAKDNRHLTTDTLVDRILKFLRRA